MNVRMNTLFYLSKKKINKHQKAPIYCRITIQGQRAEFSTGIYINPKEWRNNSVAYSHPESALYNAKLSAINTKLNGFHITLSMAGHTVTAEIIKEKFFEVPVDTTVSFVSLLAQLVSEVQKSQTASDSTKFTYMIRQKNIERFLKREKKYKILLSQVSIDLCRKFENYYRKKDFTYNYINKHIYLIGQVLKEAIRRKIISQNPLAFYQYIKDAEKPILALTEDELKKMEQYSFVSKKLQYVADLYVFQCYTGLAFVDLMNFNPKKHITIIDGQQYIIINRQKTSGETIVPVFEQTARLLNKYKNQLPVISNQKYNAYIKEVADVVGIEKNLTTHTARKTFGMIKLNEGYSIEAVARMMGHNSTKVTQKTYARVTHVRIKKEFQELKKIA